MSEQTQRAPSLLALYALTYGAEMELSYVLEELLLLTLRDRTIERARCIAKRIGMKLMPPCCVSATHLEAMRLAECARQLYSRILARALTDYERHEMSLCYASVCDMYQRLYNVAMRVQVNDYAR